MYTGTPLTGLCLIGFSLFCAVGGCSEPAKASLMDRVTLAPTAVTIPMERLHQDVLDSRAPLDTYICLRAQEKANVEVKVEVDEGLLGEMTLLNPSGEVLDARVLEKHRKFYSLRGWSSPGSPSQCLRIQVKVGWSMVSVKWRIR